MVQIWRKCLGFDFEVRLRLAKSLPIQIVGIEPDTGGKHATTNIFTEGETY